MIRSASFFTVLAALASVVACATSESPAPAASAPETTPTATEPTEPTPAPTSSAAGSDAGSAQPPAGSTCPAPIGAFAESEYFRPMRTPTKGACSAADVTTLTRPSSGGWAAVRGKVSASCASCVFANASDAQWAFVVFVDAETGLTNYAGCNALAGDTTACNKANNAWRFCTRKACGSCDSKAQNGCAESESLEGQCKAFYEADQACPGGLKPACTDVFTMIESYCGP